MSQELLMLSGLPASGKTTFAMDLVKKDFRYGRINRDDLREMLFSGKWTPKNEDIVVDVEKAIAEVLLGHGRNPVIDDTNLSPKHKSLWRGFLNDMFVLVGKTPEFAEKFFDTPLEECIERDRARERKVGRNVIVKFALRNGLVKWPDRDIVLVDIDGTLAQSTGREKYLEGEKKNWDKYYSLLHTDCPVTHIFKWVAELSKEYTIVVVSGRGAEWADQTLEWFEKVWKPNPLFPDLEVPRFPVFQWIFRDKGDRRPDDIVKREFLKLLPRKPVLILDDRPRVVRMWRAEGLTVIPVAGDCEDF